MLHIKRRKHTVSNFALARRTDARTISNPYQFHDHRRACLRSHCPKVFRAHSHPLRRMLLVSSDTTHVFLSRFTEIFTSGVEKNGRYQGTKISHKAGEAENSQNRPSIYRQLHPRE